MQKILLVIQREYFTRVKKPSFWILTIVVPILIAAVYSIPVIMATRPLEKSIVLVVDDSHVFQKSFESSSEVSYRPAASIDKAKEEMKNNEDVNAIVYIPARETTIPSDAFLYYLSDAPAINVQEDVDRQLQTILRDNILLDVHNISADDYEMISNTTIKLHTLDIETGRDSFLEVKIAIGVILAMLIFMAIFMFGSQVMRGVMEEKTNRIVEVIVSSVRPFQLMMGKVVGIGLVGLSQFVLWLVLSGIGLGAIQIANGGLFEAATQQQNVTELATKGSDATAQMAAAADAVQVPEIMEGLVNINFSLIIGVFFFYFIFGYLLYATLFASVGSVTDNETDSQQFTLPLTIPLILTFLFITSFMNEPSGTLATWLSIIPFTSPVAMMFRIPFGVPIWQVVLSMALLVGTFPLSTWIAAKIYRTGILRYGQKTTWSDLLKWVKTSK